MDAAEYRGAILALARGALAAGVGEQPPGSHRGPQVDAYLAGCVRGGRLLGLRGLAWCASFASWCAYSAWSQVNLGADWRPVALAWPRVPATVVAPAHGYRAAVSELYRDAVLSGAWRGADVGYEPVPGDLCVMGRDGQDPRHGGEGHVAVVDEVVDGGWWCIGGNEGHAVRRSARTLSDVDEPVMGWVAAVVEGG